MTVVTTGPITRKLHRSIKRTLTESTSDTAASPTLATINESAKPTVTASRRSIMIGINNLIKARSECGRSFIWSIPFAASQISTILGYYNMNQSKKQSAICRKTGGNNFHCLRFFVKPHKIIRTEDTGRSGHPPGCGCPRRCFQSPWPPGRSARRCASYPPHSYRGW